MYKCELCATPSQSGQPRLVHVVRKPDGNVAREIAVCHACKRELDGGQTVQKLRSINQKSPVRFLPETVGTALDLN